MRFCDKLKKAMSDLGLSQRQICNLTGIGASSISQYVSGKNEPTAFRKKQIAVSLGLPERYFEDYDPDTVVTYGADNLTVEVAAKLMHKSKEFVKQGLRDGVFPFGYAVKLKNWSYFISAKKFSEFTGIEIPLKIAS